MTDNRTPEQRFWIKVDKRGPEECWPWIGAKSDDYGQMKFHGRFIRAHRISFEINKGEIPPGHVIHHACSTKLCVNPAHLSAIAPGFHTSFHKRGARNGRAKLTLEQVEDVRSRRLSQKKFARMYGVHRNTIRYIQWGVTWK